jgi:hypothetical protein
MLIYTKDITQDFWTGAGGMRLGDYIANYVIKNQNAVYPLQVSFLDIDNITPSFVNGAFLYLIDVFGQDFLKRYVKVIQANAQVAQTIRHSVQTYFDYQKEFFAQLKTNHIYCAIDGSEEGKKFRYELYELTKRQGFSFLFNPNDTTFSIETKANIFQSDVFIGIISSNYFGGYILEQANYAIQECQKPCILFCKYDVKLDIKKELRNKIHIVYYGQGNYLQKRQEISNIIQHNKQESIANQKTTNTNQNAIAWTLLGLGAVALIGYLLQEETVEK